MSADDWGTLLRIVGWALMVEALPRSWEWWRRVLVTLGAWLMAFGFAVAVKW